MGPELIVQHAMVLNHIHGDMESYLHVFMIFDPPSRSLSLSLFVSFQLIFLEILQVTLSLLILIIPVLVCWVYIYIE